MSGSRLGRGRGGRLAVYAACGVVVILLVFLYRAATSEMSRLQELHVQCAHQQEALAAQLQVIFEYKVRLEKSLAEEKSSNAAFKQELQQRASREKSLRDKDSVEALQRFNSLQQIYKILQTEHQDLRDECSKQQKQALEESKTLEGTLQDLRTQIKESRQDKIKSMEHLKTKYIELETDKTKLEDKYNALMKINGNTDSTIEHLRKEVIQLNRELKEVQQTCKATSPGPSEISQRSPQQISEPKIADSNVGRGIETANGQQDVRSSPQQQQQQQIPQNSPTTSRNLIPVAKMQSSTKSGVNSASTVSNKPANPVAGVRQSFKVKLPSGVLPIPNIIENNVESNVNNENIRKNDAVNNSAIKAAKSNDDTKDQDKNHVENGVIQAPAAVVGHRHMGDEVLNRQDDNHWMNNLRVKPGIQEIGDDLENLGKLVEFDEGRQVGDVGDYDDNLDDYNKGPQLKNNGEESEDEREEEDEVDYPNNDLKKQE